MSAPGETGGTTLPPEAPPTVWVDADGCPVVDETVRLARRFGAECVLVCDTAHRMEKPGARTLVVSKGPDSADFALVNRVRPGDMVVTQDYGLAAMCLAKQAAALRQDGLRYDDASIGPLLNARWKSREIRRSGGRLKGPRKRTAAEDAAFCAALEQWLTNRLSPDGKPNGYPPGG